MFVCTCVVEIELYKSSPARIVYPGYLFLHENYICTCTWSRACVRVCVCNILLYVLGARERCKRTIIHTPPCAAYVIPNALRNGVQLQREHNSEYSIEVVVWLCVCMCVHNTAWRPCRIKPTRRSAIQFRELECGRANQPARPSFAKIVGANKRTRVRSPITVPCFFSVARRARARTSGGGRGHHSSRRATEQRVLNLKKKCTRGTALCTPRTRRVRAEICRQKLMALDGVCECASLRVL